MHGIGGAGMHGNGSGLPIENLKSGDVGLDSRKDLEAAVANYPCNVTAGELLNALNRGDDNRSTAECHVGLVV